MVQACLEGMNVGMRVLAGGNRAGAAKTVTALR